MVTELSADCHFCRRLQGQPAVFNSGCSTKGLLRRILLQREYWSAWHLNLRVRPSLAFTIFFDRGHRSVDEEAIRDKWGMAVVNRVVEQYTLADKIRGCAGGEDVKP